MIITSTPTKSNGGGQRIETCFPAKEFGWTNGHHYVWFAVDPTLTGWLVKKPWWVIDIFKAMLWADPDGDGNAYAGFRWKDYIPVLLPKTLLYAESIEQTFRVIIHNEKYPVLGPDEMLFISALDPSQ